jgi:hypothetical protein
MSKPIDNDLVAKFRSRLEQHAVYAAVATIEDLRCFMQHHVYSVWDFMSLIKYLQAATASTRVPWVPEGDGSVRRFINELVLEEESDETHVDGEHASHFELYLRAMREIGADTGPIERFVDVVRGHGIDTALELPEVPEASRRFTRTTFDIIAGDRPHEVAAALALGREHIIPGMFRSILARIGVGEDLAPIFHFYLNRHIHLDEDFHAPLSLRLLNNLCGGDEASVAEAIDAAHRAVEARLVFWDGVAAAIAERRQAPMAAGATA